MSSLDCAEAAYLASIFRGDDSDLDSSLAALTGSGPSVDLARGKLLHCRNLPDRPPDPSELDCFVRAADGFQAEHDVAGLASAIFWQGCYFQVICGDDDRAVPLLRRALAAEADDRLTASYCLRHLAIANHKRGNLEEAERQLVESTAQRRSLGFTAGVAANLVGLSYIALGRGDRYQAERHAHDAIAAALAIDATKVLADAEEALASIPS
jgi:hypothetical protein